MGSRLLSIRHSAKHTHFAELNPDWNVEHGELFWLD